MKIVTWNCNGALRKKFEKLLDLNADLLVIQECENPIETNHKEYKLWAKNHLWIGDTKNKGLGIFTPSNIELKLLNWTNSYKDHYVKHFLPCSVNGDFDLLAVWTHKNNSPNFGYIGQFWKYLQINKNKLNNIIIAGDFNSNVIWDEWDRWWNHSDVINILKQKNIESLYHKVTNEEQGKESKKTFFLQRKIEKDFHIDYFFGSSNFQNPKGLTLGNYNDWIGISDHIPLTLELENYG